MNPMKAGLGLAGEIPVGHQPGGPVVLYVGLDFSCKRLDWRALAGLGELI
jgi:hypothetical protein